MSRENTIMILVVVGFLVVYFVLRRVIYGLFDKGGDMIRDARLRAKQEQQAAGTGNVTGASGASAVQAPIFIEETGVPTKLADRYGLGGLKASLDAGLLTQEEFEQKKCQVLRLQDKDGQRAGGQQYASQQYVGPKSNTSQYAGGQQFSGQSEANTGAAAVRSKAADLEVTMPISAYRDDYRSAAQEPVEEDVRFCPQCGASNHGDSMFCWQCGTRLRNVCPQCGVENDRDSHFCWQCGTRLK